MLELAVLEHIFAEALDTLFRPGDFLETGVVERQVADGIERRGDSDGFQRRAITEHTLAYLLDTFGDCNLRQVFPVLTETFGNGFHAGRECDFLDSGDVVEHILAEIGATLKDNLGKVGALECAFVYFGALIERDAAEEMIG